MKRTLIAALLVAAPFTASAFNGTFKDTCSVKADKTAKKSDLIAMAKIKPEEAKKIAMDEVKGSKVNKGGIETEDGCLIYSYHVSDSNKGQTEVFVDAGNGKVLGTEKEGKFRTAMEKPVDKTKELAGKAKQEVTGKPSTNQAMGK
jgi:hypothetical protein